MTLTWAWILVTLAAVVAYLIGYGRRPAPAALEAKEFGLEEAQAARAYVTDPTHAKTVKAVVVGVLGYKDVVADQVREEIDDLEAFKAKNLNYKAGYEDEIEALQAKIVDLVGANKGFDANIADLGTLKNMFA